MRAAHAAAKLEAQFAEKKKPRTLHRHKDGRRAPGVHVRNPNALG